MSQTELKKQLLLLKLLANAVTIQNCRIFTTKKLLLYNILGSEIWFFFSVKYFPLSHYIYLYLQVATWENSLALVVYSPRCEF